MFKHALLLLHSIGWYMFYPFEYLWRFIFAVKVDVRDKMMFTGEAGGGGKSTISAHLASKYGHTNVNIDKCKYGANWTRYPVGEFVERVNSAVSSSPNDMYVIDGVYTDEKLPTHQEKMDELMDIVDVVVWNELSVYICIWRKLFRSFKRYIGAVEQGAAQEKLHDVIANTKKTWYNYDTQHQKLADKWRTLSGAKYKRVKWPWFYTVD